MMVRGFSRPTGMSLDLVLETEANMATTGALEESQVSECNLVTLSSY